MIAGRESAAKAPLTEAVLAALTHTAGKCSPSVVAVPCGYHLLRQGSRLNEVFIVRTGRLRVVMVSRSGWEVACSECRPGDCFGALGPSPGRSVAASVVAMENSVVWRMKACEFHTLATLSPAVAMAALSQMAERLELAFQQCFETTALSVRARIANSLLRSARLEDGRYVIDPVPTHADLALRIGSKREVVSRELARMHELGIIARCRPRIIVTQPSRLAALTEFPEGMIP